MTTAKRFIVQVDDRPEITVSVPENPVCGARPECCERHEDLYAEMLSFIKHLAETGGSIDATTIQARALLAKI